MSSSSRPLTAALALLLVAALASAAEPPTAAELAGAWAGTAEHDGETTPFAIELEPPDADGRMMLKATIPAAHFVHAPFGKVPLSVEQGRVKLGPFLFDYDAQQKTLTGVVPAGLAPVYALPLRLRNLAVDVPVAPRRLHREHETIRDADARLELVAERRAIESVGVEEARRDVEQRNVVIARDCERARHAQA